MNVAFVHDWLNGMRGGEKVLEALLPLWPDADIYTLFYEPEKISPVIRRHQVFVSALQKLPGARRQYRNLLPLFPWAIKQFELSRYDLVISVSHCVAHAAIASSPDHHFCYCLSPMRYLWSQMDSYSNAKQTGVLSRLGMAALGGPLRAWDRATNWRAGRFCAISETIADRIQLAYNRPSEVIYPPVDTIFYTPGHAREGQYYLAVSSAVPYKRLDLAIEACNTLHLPLKIVGGGPGMARLQKMAGHTVEILGWVSDEQLRELYRGCKALIFTPEEDFGIAPLEAQACGKPVLAYGRGGALETVIGGQTGAFFYEQRSEILIEALKHFDAQRFTPADCRANALRFGKERFQAQFRAAIDRFLVDHAVAVR